MKYQRNKASMIGKITRLLPEEMDISLAACSLHLINSVGQRVKEEKKAAIHPAVALAVALKSSTFCDNTNKALYQENFEKLYEAIIKSKHIGHTLTPEKFATTFWQTPYPANKTEFSATLATIAGMVPA